MQFKTLFAFLFVAFAALLSQEVEAKTAVFHTQGLWDETCKEMGEKFEWNCQLVSEKSVSAFACRQLCAAETKPCYEIDNEACHCCFME